MLKVWSLMKAWREEKGAALLLVLVLLALGGMLLTPMLQSVFVSQRSGQIHTRLLKAQYARDAAAEYAMWQLLYGDTTLLLSDEGDEIIYPLDFNGVTINLRIRLGTELTNATVTGAEDNRVRLTSSVVCEVSATSNDFDDDCSNLPPNITGMRAKYTVYLDQVSPDTSVPVVAIYDEIPSQFDWDPLANPAVSNDLSFPEISLVTPTNIGSSQNQIWKWDFSSTPLYFEQGQVRQFTFVTSIDETESEYCNRTFTKMAELPHESSGPAAIIQVGSKEGCANGGTIVAKYVNQILALPNQTSIFTYVVNVENIQRNTQHIDLIKDVLPQGGFLFCNGPTQGDPFQSCNPSMSKLVSDNFDPENDSFSDTTDFTAVADPFQTLLDPDGTPGTGDERWELVWNAVWKVDQAGQPQDTFILRFQAEFTPTESGTFYNEIFIDVNCAVPEELTTEPNNVSSQADYCASYSWPAGGVLVPTYEVMAQTGGTDGWGSISIGSGSGRLESWHVE